VRSFRREVRAFIAVSSLLAARAASAQEAAQDTMPTPNVPAAKDTTPGPSVPAAKDTTPPPKVPFGFGDFTWMNGQSHQTDFPLAFSKFISVNLYFDTYFAYSTGRPADNTIVGSASVGRHNEFQINLASVGVQVNYRHVLATLALQTGDMLNIVQDLDLSALRGKNLTTLNLHNIREATAGYHWDKAYGLNVEAGIFLSYIGLESYLLAENWDYHRSLVCDFTPFYFQGVRIQYFPNEHLKIEPWIMNGWQSYGKFNTGPGVGTSIYYRPSESLGFIANFYYGQDTPLEPRRKRFHNDHSILYRYFNRPTAIGLSKAAFSINNHIGFQSGGGVRPESAYMRGTAIANRVWFDQNHAAFTVRGEYITNPTRYLSPPAAFSLVGDQNSLKIGGVTETLDLMPTDFMAFRFEAVSRWSNVPFFAGPGGTTTAAQGFPIPIPAPGAPLPPPLPFTPDGVKNQTLLIAAINFRL
jgi:hypothetical protein